MWYLTERFFRCVYHVVTKGRNPTDSFWDFCCRYQR